MDVVSYNTVYMHAKYTKNFSHGLSGFKRIIKPWALQKLLGILIIEIQ